MNVKADSSTHRFDIVKWLIVTAIVMGGVYANTLYATVGVFYRALAGVGIAAVAAAIALQTEHGRAAWNLAQETTQTTLIVVLVVFIVGLLLWGLDSGLSWGVRAIIG
jgi:preprotein translocase subunit SecE